MSNRWPGRVTIRYVDVVLWIVLGVVLAIAEIFTVSFFLIMFAFGAFAAAGAAALGAPIALQGLVFAVVSALAVLGMRPALRAHFGRDSDVPTPVAEIAGSEALVLERVDADHGVVKIDGEFWQARALDAAQVIEPGERVRVVEIKGVTAMVWRD
jgi:membrane protein implicated in regulation of membrane protease activity